MDSTSTPASFVSPSTNKPENAPGFDTIDGYVVSSEEGEAALRSGRAVLVGGLLVVLFAF
jgi:hypothetical protein